MLVSQDAEMNRSLGRISLQMYKDGYYHVLDAQPSAADDLSMKDGFYGAPVSITVFTPSIWDVGRFDAAMSILRNLRKRAKLAKEATGKCATPSPRHLAKYLPIWLAARTFLMR